MINYNTVIQGFKKFKEASPFNYCVIDNFFSEETAHSLANQFPNYDSTDWFYYNNLIENKKALNDWNKFPALTYQAFSTLYSQKMIALLSELMEKQLYPDYGLHGGGWHIHATGGNLHPHLDYSIHPKMGLERKLNIIIYLSPELDPDRHGGHLGLWEADLVNNRPSQLAHEVAPVFNRAVIFDTTQNSWHGLSRPLSQPEGIYRKSLAAYYLCDPAPNAEQRYRALFSPRDNELENKEMLDIIKLRSDLNLSASVYRITDKK